jgi:hypothetical protein
VGPELLGVGVDEADDLAPQHPQSPPHRIALAEHRTVLGPQLVLIVDLGPEAARDLSGPVGRVVDDHDLIDDPPRPQRLDLLEDRSDRACFVARG